jgi:hypothetical protein
MEVNRRVREGHGPNSKNSLTESGVIVAAGVRVTFWVASDG